MRAKADDPSALHVVLFQVRYGLSTHVCLFVHVCLSFHLCSIENLTLLCLCIYIRPSIHLYDVSPVRQGNVKTNGS